MPVLDTYFGVLEGREVGMLRSLVAVDVWEAVVGKLVSLIVVLAEVVVVE
ncbi:MAG: hypothetical protein AAF471_03240 [Myxococcota bacterium]